MILYRLVKNFRHGRYLCMYVFIYLFTFAKSTTYSGGSPRGIPIFAISISPVPSSSSHEHWSILTHSLAMVGTMNSRRHTSDFMFDFVQLKSL